MRRKTGRIRKIALLMLTTGCIVAAASAAYAGAPSSGPASDNRTVEERQMSEEGQAKQESMPPAGEIQESTQAGEEAVLAVTQGETRQTPEVQQNWRKKFRKKRKQQVLSGAEDGISIRLSR